MILVGIGFIPAAGFDPQQLIPLRFMIHMFLPLQNN
jgi:hypothetical protein